MGQKTFLSALCFFTLIITVSCNNNDGESQEIVEEQGNPVEVVFGESQTSPILTADDYELITEEALELFDEATPQYKPGRENYKKWFIRYYVQNYELNESWSEEEIFQMAAERAEYEEAWKVYAEEQYEVVAEEEAINDQAEYNLEIYHNNLPPSVYGMAEALGLSIEEFMLDFDRDHAERTVIWEELKPLLVEKHTEEEATRLDSVYLGQQFEQEVTEFLEDNEV